MIDQTEALHEQIAERARQARAASRAVASMSAGVRTMILLAMADGLVSQCASIRAANRDDLDAAVAAGLSEAMLDRLRLDDARINAMADALRAIADQPDVLGKVIDTRRHANGMTIEKVRVPLGVIAMIYESRPNVTADAAGLCFKAGNAVILRGGSESLRTNLAIHRAMLDAAAAAGLPADAIQLIDTTSRDAVTALLKQDQSIDLVIPRGGEGLIRAVAEQSRIPVLKHYKGVCHVYVDRAADLEMAQRIAINAKCQRPGVCNAMETLLIHHAVAPDFAPRIAEAMTAHGVALRGDDAFCRLVPLAQPADESDWSAEYLALILAVRIVDDLDAAVEHIERYGSRHSDAIVTADAHAAQQFVNAVDSATVYVNASTRFTDGGEFGMGAEIGISTDKLHARGPCGAEALTSTKWVIHGTGQVRD